MAPPSGNSTALVLVKPEDGGERLVDPPHLFWCDVPDEVAEPLCIDRADVLDEHPGSLTRYVDLGSERCGASAERGGSDEDDRTREELVRLHHDAEPVAVLFVTNSSREPEPVDVTPQHGALP